MPPRSPTFGHALVAAAVLGSLPALLPMLRDAELLPTVTSPTAALASLALVAATGRVLLSLLPPATNGNRATTWATSHLLGIILLSGTSIALAALDLHPSLAALAAPWLLFGLAAWLTGPGDLVPRHAPARPTPNPLARTLELLTAALALAPLAAHLAGRTLLLHTPSGHALGLPPNLTSSALAALGPAATPAVTLAALPAAALFVRHALAAASASALRTAATPLALVLLPAPFAFASSSAAAPTAAALPLALLAATAAAAFGSIALLRADRRAALITLAAGLSLAWLTPRALAPLAPAFAAAIPLALFLATPPPGRRRIATPLLAALAAGLAIGLTLALDQTSTQGATAATASPLAPAFAALASYDLSLFGTLFLLADAAGLILLFRRPWSAPPRPRPTLLFAFTLAVLCCLFALTAELLFGTLWPQPAGHWHTTAPQLLTLLAPSALLMLALSADELLPTRE